MTAIETNRKLDNAGSKIITKRALGLFDKMESSTSDTDLSRRRGSLGNDPFVSSDEIKVVQVHLFFFLQTTFHAKP
jgi:hypothetical protein